MKKIGVASMDILDRRAHSLLKTMSLLIKRRIEMLINRKMLLGLVLAVGLVSAGIGVLAPRSTNRNGTLATNKPETTAAAPANLTEPAQKTTDQLASDKPAQANSTNVVSNGTRRYSRRYSNGRSVYYDYGNQPRGRTFWQKHRDKLTVAMGTGGGALLGGLIGGKRGAGIGALAGAGGSALYTYKLRKRTRRY